MLSLAANDGHVSAILSMGTTSYEIDFRALTQRNSSTGHVRRIFRGWPTSPPASAPHWSSITHHHGSYPNSDDEYEEDGEGEEYFDEDDEDSPEPFESSGPEVIRHASSLNGFHAFFLAQDHVGTCSAGRRRIGERCSGTQAAHLPSYSKPHA